ncbi:DUF2867 domain-containing protein [Kitasatospora sp. NPDC097643]|uniref:DUF2867 domain-containing protein n=1 Tax=Kitasatospora sp. NPDC097643 TaxID=3157230 RepID=UPI003322DCA7
MRLPRTTHTDQPWRVHEYTRDFRIEDVWSYRTPGAGPDDFRVMYAALRAGARMAEQGPAARFLFAVRWKLGALFGWDDPATGLGARVESLRDRLPGELRDTVDGVADPGMPLTPVYELADEAVGELANRTVHTLMHLGWAPNGSGGYELRMAVLVKPNGRFGRIYMALIAPFRYLVIYPGLTRQWEQAWRDRERLLAHGVPGAPSSGAPSSGVSSPGGTEDTAQDPRRRP